MMNTYAQRRNYIINKFNEAIDKLMAAEDGELRLALRKQAADYAAILTAIGTP